MDFTPFWVTIALASVTTASLIVVAMPIAWWLAHTSARIKPAVEAVTALPLVLPPTVMGFYLLVLFSPQAPLGRIWVEVTGQSLTFSFWGLVIASIVYSLPFAVQPLQSAFESVGRGPLEAAAMAGAGPWDAFWNIAVPLASRGFLTAAILTFAHTVGEFGIVLMVGGNIPGETRVISIAIYEHVETLEYAQAHAWSAGLLIFSFAVLLLVFTANRRYPMRIG